MQWQDIEKVMHTLENPTGGFSPATRGIVTMPDGMKVFVKVVGGEENKRWIQKEIAVYEMLQSRNFPYVPRLLTHNNDLTGFALEALSADNGWDWTDTWNASRLAATLQAMDELARLVFNQEEKNRLGAKSITKDADGWRVLERSIEKQGILRQKLTDVGREDIAATVNIQAMAAKSTVYPFKDNVVVHHDVRADNCAWCPTQRKVKLIDWEWTQLGDRTIDRNAMLAHAYTSGFDVLNHYRNVLHADALNWLAGFWLNASTNPLPVNNQHNPRVRDYQLASGIAALELASKLK